MDDIKALANEVKAPLTGMGITRGYSKQERVTIQYPEVRRPMPRRSRWRHVLNRYENGMEKCIGCSLCAGACPANAILVVAAENTEENRVSPGERFAAQYEINMRRCIFCGYCVEACPTDAITHGHGFELASLNATTMVMRKEDLLVPISRSLPNSRGEEAEVLR